MRSVGFSLLLILVVECCVLLIPTESSRDEVSALMAFKHAIYEDPFSVLTDWNSGDANPCNWVGINCSESQDRVISIDLSNSSLKGFLAPEIGRLSSLQELLLANNLLLGTIPKEVGMLKSLIVLDLSTNHLTGSIPQEIENLTGITKINLYSNGLTGGAPSVLGNLVNLVELRLDRNRLNGHLPGSDQSDISSSTSNKFASQKQRTGLCPSTKLKVADFSYNFFVGSIPSCLKYLPRSSFQGNCLQDKGALLQRSAQKCASSNAGKEINRHASSKHQRPQQPEWLLILELITGAIIAVSLVTASITAFRKCRRKSSNVTPLKRDIKWKDQIAISCDGEIMKNLTRLSRQEVEVSCEDFSNIIGSSQDSTVYKGILKDGREIAVISLSFPQENWTTYLEFFFETKVADLARLNHVNIAKLVGYCKEEDPFTRMLVFDYASNGTLYEHLQYGEGSQLSWLRRMKIAIGIARGLKYLHTELQPPFALSELNSKGVYLTEDFSPKLVDFECWKFVYSKSEKKLKHISNGGAFYGLVSLEQRHFEMQTNTYAFGVMLLEIISGRPPYSKHTGRLVDWAMEYLQQPEKVGNLVDPTITNVNADELAVICGVVSLCIEPDPSKRPSMQIITRVLENGIDTSPAAALKGSPWAELALSS